MVVSENGPMSVDLSHIYSGTLEGGYDQDEGTELTGITAFNHLTSTVIYSLDKTSG